MKYNKVRNLIFILFVTILSCKDTGKSNTSSTNQEVEETQSIKETEPTVKAHDAKGSKRILFVGNSHTEFYISLPKLFEELCKTNKQDFKIETLIEMGVALDEIYNTRKDFITGEMSKKDADGNYFDYVVLQEKTPVAIDEPETYKANVKMFVDAIHKNSPGTVVLLYELIDPLDYKKEKADFDTYFPIIKSNASDIVKETSNSRLLKIGSAIKDAYDGEYDYKAYKGEEDLLRHGESTLHMLNDAGFMASVLLYETIFNSIPQIPASLPFSDGVNTGGKMSPQEVNKVVTNKEALMKIAFGNK